MKVTNEVLYEKIMNVDKKIDEFILPDVRENTKFRQNSKGYLAALTLLFSAIAFVIQMIF